MDRSSKKINFIITVLFVGVILSFAAVYFIGALMGDETEYSDSYLKPDVEVEEYPLFTDFWREIYKSRSSHEFVKKIDYILFRELSDSGVLAGSNDFLFDVEKEDGGYNYIRDYLGQSEFTDEELNAIAESLAEWKDFYRASGAELIVVVVPSSHTVYSEHMPLYIGQMSDNTCLSQLEAYLAERECDYFLDLTDELISAKKSGYIYNNTENSLTALGAYEVYKSTMKRLDATLPLYDGDDLTFYMHLTEGRSSARAAGIEALVKNRTISASGSFTQIYDVRNRGDLRITNTAYAHLDAIEQGNYLTLEFDDEQLLLQLMPYFSNTYSNVTYKFGFDGDVDVKKSEKVVRFVSESSLRRLLIKP